MTTTNYSGLFEDEVAELLRSLPDNADISPHYGWTYHKTKSNVIDEDGIRSTMDETCYCLFIGRDRSGKYPASYLIRSLAHADFTVTTYD